MHCFLNATQKILRLFGYAILVSMVLVTPLYAQENAMTLTITPPLIQVNLQPGETWSSGIQVVNGNRYDMTVYAEPVLFEPAGEDGRPKFKNAPGVGGESAAPDPTTLAGWITLPEGGFPIVAEQTITIPLTIQVPTDAAPGGHYAAILIGNQAPEGGREESALSVTSSIASLILLRVAGDVVEDGRIRDFATEKMMYEKPEAQLSLRFENQGNVHLQPRGTITIYNMFNKVRGSMVVNQGGDYGNVMPGSIRKFSYTWKADAGTWDIGRYRAEATLGFGGESKSFAQATTYFYILPLVPIVELVGGLIALMLFIGWALRAYVRKAIAMEAGRVEHPHVEPHVLTAGVRPIPQTTVETPKLTLTTLIRPLGASMVDLRSVTRPKQNVEEQHVSPRSQIRTADRHLTLMGFAYRYRHFFIFVVVVAVVWVVASYMFVDALTYERPYEVQMVDEDGTPAPMR